MNKETKRCPKCGEIKPLLEFYKDKTQIFGVRGWCKECCAISSAKWQKEHHEERRIYNAKWQKENPENVRASKAKWAKSNPENVRARVAKYRAKHPEKLRARDVNYRMNHPEKIRINNRNRWARKNNAPGNGVTVEQWQQILKLFGNRCLYPDCDRADITMDHIVPIKIGGAHDTYNVQPLCGRHNSSKGTKTIDYRGLKIGHEN